MKKSSTAGIGILFLFTIVLIGSAKAEQSTDEAADIAAIRSLEKKFTASYLERDWDAFSALFADDGMWMPPNRSPLVGEEAWWSMIGPFWGFKPAEAVSTIDEIIVSGDLAIERHHEYTVYRPADGGEPTISHNKGIHVLQRQADNSWRIARYIWNANPPSP